jgi:cell division protein FtsB
MDALAGIDFTCPDCGHRSRYPLVHGGKPAPCPACKKVHVIPAVTPSSSPLPVAPPAKPTGDAEKILFVCSSCGCRARIPAQYAGMAVRCPTCDVAQIANPEGAVGSTGRTVQLSKMPTATHATTVRPGNILFICSQCNFEAQLAKHYVGKAIRCPGCHAPQVVAGPPAATGAGSALEPAKEGGGPASDPRFICVACGYRARIPTQYMGLAVTCPKCETAQFASPEESESPSTGDTVAIARIKTVEELPANAHGAVPTLTQGASAGAVPASTVLAGAASGDKVRFTCSACGFKARIPANYAGQSIHCPGCNATQTVLRSGQPSGAATGNTQVISIVQTAASPDAIAQPTHTPSHGMPILPAEPAIAPPAKPAAGIPTAAPARPQAPPAIAKPAPPKPAPAAPAAVAAPAPAMPPEEKLNFEEETPKPEQPMGKVVRRSSSGRMLAAGGKTPPPAAPAQPDDEASEMAALKASLGKPKAGVKPATAPPKADPPQKPEPKAAAKPAPRVERSEEPAVPQKSSSALMVVIILFMVVLLGLVGGGGYFGLNQLNQLDAKLTAAGDELKKTTDELKKANEKLAQAETDAKQAKADAEAAKKKQEEESAARKVADEKAAELEKKLKEQEAKAAAPAPDAAAPEKK